MAATLDDVLDAITLQTQEIRGMSVATASAAQTWFKASSATSITLLGANARRMAIIVNTDANDLWIRYGRDPATTGSGGWTYKIPSGATWEMPQPAFVGPIQGIWTAAGAGVAETTEF